MENCLIRLARKEDYDGVETIMKQVQDLHVGWRPDIYKTAETVLPQEMFFDAVDEGLFVAAECAGEVVGLLFLQLRHIENPIQVTRNVLYVDSMAVKEGFRGRGIGHQMFDFVKMLAREKGVDGIELQVNAKNAQAKKMYESYGFTEKSINMELLGGI